MTAEEALHICKLATKCAMFDQQCTDMTEFIDAMKQKYDPYVMVYDKPHAPKEIKMLQRWCNNKIIFKSVKKFEDYNRRTG